MKKTSHDHRCPCSSRTFARFQDAKNSFDEEKIPNLDKDREGELLDQVRQAVDELANENRRIRPLPAHRAKVLPQARSAHARERANAPQHCENGPAGVQADARARYPHVAAAARAPSSSFAQRLGARRAHRHGGRPSSLFPRRPEHLAESVRGGRGGAHPRAEPRGLSTRRAMKSDGSDGLPLLRRKVLQAYAALAPPRSTRAHGLARRQRALRPHVAAGRIAALREGLSRGPLPLSLSRGYHAPQLPAVLAQMAGKFGGRRWRSAALAARHTGEYGTGMMIMHWRVAEGLFPWGARAVRARGVRARWRASPDPRFFTTSRGVRAPARGLNGCVLFVVLVASRSRAHEGSLVFNSNFRCPHISRVLCGLSIQRARVYPIPPVIHPRSPNSACSERVNRHTAAWTSLPSFR